MYHWQDVLCYCTVAIGFELCLNLACQLSGTDSTQDAETEDQHTCVPAEETLRSPEQAYLLLTDADTITRIESRHVTIEHARDGV
jgi:hypothetical protein